MKRKLVVPNTSSGRNGRWKLAKRAAAALAFVGSLLSVYGPAATAQTSPRPASSAQTVVIREVAPAEVHSTVKLGAIVGVRALRGGNVLVSDGGNLRLVLLDERMGSLKVVIDSGSADGRGYGLTPTSFIAYLGDTTLFVDRQSGTMSVIDPAGTITRVIAPPNPTDIRLITAFSGGADKSGNLIYRGVTPRDPSAPPQSPMVSSLQPPDSAPIVRANFDTRKVDTLARVKVAGNVRAKMETNGPQTVLAVTVNPLLTIDDWSLLSDGTIAIVRGQDYHVDLIHPDGSITVGPKLPFDWKPVTEEEKTALLDSLHAVHVKEKIATPNGISLPPGGSLSRVSVRPGVGMSIERKEVSRSEIADYWPPIRFSAAKSDADGNLWILPTTSAQSKAGELIYDVINNRGEITHRVRLPAGRSIAGFGRGGIVYLMGRNDDKTWYLERTHVITR